VVVSATAFGRYAIDIQSKNAVLAGVSGSMPIPLNIAGSEIGAIDELTLPISTPSVVFDSAIHS